MRDFIVRAITRNGEFRVIAAVMTNTVAQAMSGVSHPPEVAEAFARSMVGTALIRSGVHPGERFQLHFRNVGKVREIRVDSWPEGHIRGYAVAHEDPSAYFPVTDQVFMVGRTRRIKGDEPYQSILSVVSGNITDEVERYLQHSAQIEASVTLEVDIDADGRVVWAAGVLAMPLPEATREDLAALVARLEHLAPLREMFGAGEPEGLVRGVLPQGYDFAIVADEVIQRLCVCSEARVLEMLKSLGSEQLRSLLAEGEPVVVDCAYCAEKRFEVPLVQLAHLAGEAN